MNKDSTTTTVTRTWRDLAVPPVRPAAMSRGGRWRRRWEELRVVAVVMLVGGLGWVGWRVAAALGENGKAMPAEARGVPLKATELKTDGVLTQAWLERTLALRKGISLLELDLEALQARLLADGQVATANLTRRFPDRLAVQITERLPVARVMAEIAGERRQLLVARDGVMFAGTGYDATFFDTLLWLDGVEIKRRGGQLQPLAGVDVAADLIAKAQFEANHLYRTWHVVSLARLESDRELEVRTSGAQQITIVFAANPNEERLSRDASFLKQIAKLDYLWDTIGAKQNVRGHVDLSFGRQVPVVLEEIPVAPEAGAAPWHGRPAREPQVGMITTRGTPVPLESPAPTLRPTPPASANSLHISFDLSRPQPRTLREL